MPARRSATRCFAFVWLCGAIIAPSGDHHHVTRGVTEYLTTFGPVWLGRSPLWFMLLVAGFMATLAVLQGRASTRPNRDRGDAAYLSPLFILGLYLTTSVYPLREGGSLEALITVAAVLLYLVFDRTKVGLLFGLAVAIGSTAAEWGLVQLGVFRYLPESDELFGVAPWLLPLYFAASVCVGAIGRRMLRPTA